MLFTKFYCKYNRKWISINFTKLVSYSSGTSQKYNNSARGTCDRGWLLEVVVLYLIKQTIITSYSKSKTSWFSVVAEDKKYSNYVFVTEMVFVYTTYRTDYKYYWFTSFLFYLLILHLHDALWRFFVIESVFTLPRGITTQDRFIDSFINPGVVQLNNLWSYFFPIW